MTSKVTGNWLPDQHPVKRKLYRKVWKNFGIDLKYSITCLRVCLSWINIKVMLILFFCYLFFFGNFLSKWDFKTSVLSFFLNIGLVLFLLSQDLDWTEHIGIIVYCWRDSISLKIIDWSPTLDIQESSILECISIGFDLVGVTIDNTKCCLTVWVVHVRRRHLNFQRLGESCECAINVRKSKTPLKCHCTHSKFRRHPIPIWFC